MQSREMYKIRGLRRGAIMPGPGDSGAVQFVGTLGSCAGVGAAGAVAAGGTSRIERCGPVPRPRMASVSDRAKKAVPRMAVVRVSRLAVPRPDMKPPMPWEEPMPSPPPSERWRRTTPMRARVTKRWMMRRTVAMGCAGVRCGGVGVVAGGGLGRQFGR